MWYSNTTNQDCKALQKVVRLAERISGSALPSLQDIYLKRCKSRAAKIIKDSNHPGNSLLILLPSGKRIRSMMAKTERLRRSFFPQAIRLLNTNSVSETFTRLNLLTAIHSYSHHPYCCYVYIPGTTVCTSMFILLFIKSQYTVLHILFVLFYCTCYSLFLFFFVYLYLYICSCVVLLLCIFFIFFALSIEQT